MSVRQHRAPASQRPAGPAPGWALRPEVVARLHATMRTAIAGAGGPQDGLPGPGNGLSPGLRYDGSATAGQHLRPAVALAVAAIGGRTIDDPGVLPAAAAAELLHGSVRAGTPAARADVLMAAAVSLAPHVGPEAGALLAETLAHQYSGQALQDQLRYDAAAPTHRLMEVARLRAGSLFRAACLLGAMTFGGGQVFRSAAGGFGMDLGICVQLLDDLLDVTAGGFAPGTVTLPIALAVRDRPELSGMLRPGLGQASHDRAVKLLQGSTAALAATAATARTYANGAGLRLGAVASGPGPASEAARWPAAYLDSRLREEAGERYRWLAEPLAGAAH